MSQVSRRKVNDKVYARIFEILVAFLVSIDNKNKAEGFIGDLLTDTEKIVLAKRLSIAFLLLKNYTYDVVESILRVSRPTIWNVKRWMDARGEGYKSILNEFMKMEKDKKIIEGFFNLLEDIFPPMIGADWKSVR